jgi:hypothetical protein
MNASPLGSFCAAVLMMSQCSRDAGAPPSASATPPAYLSPEYVQAFAEFKRRNMPRVGTTVTALGPATWHKGRWRLPFDSGELYFHAINVPQSVVDEIWKRLSDNREVRVKVTGTLRYCDYCTPLEDKTLTSEDLAIQLTPEHFYLEDASLELLTHPPP